MGSFSPAKPQANTTAVPSLAACRTRVVGSLQRRFAYKGLPFEFQVTPLQRSFLYKWFHFGFHVNLQRRNLQGSIKPGLYIRHPQWSDVTGEGKCFGCVGFCCHQASHLRSLKWLETRQLVGLVELICMLCPLQSSARILQLDTLHLNARTAWFVRQGWFFIQTSFGIFRVTGRCNSNRAHPGGVRTLLQNR